MANAAMLNIIRNSNPRWRRITKAVWRPISPNFVQIRFAALKV